MNKDTVMTQGEYWVGVAAKLVCFYWVVVVTSFIALTVVGRILTEGTNFWLLEALLIVIMTVVLISYLSIPPICFIVQFLLAAALAYFWWKRSHYYSTYVWLILASAINASSIFVLFYSDWLDKI